MISLKVPSFPCIEVNSVDRLHCVLLLVNRHLIKYYSILCYSMLCYAHNTLLIAPLVKGDGSKAPASQDCLVSISTSSLSRSSGKRPRISAGLRWSKLSVGNCDLILDGIFRIIPVNSAAVLLDISI